MMTSHCVRPSGRYLIAFRAKSAAWVLLFFILRKIVPPVASRAIESDCGNLLPIAKSWIRAEKLNLINHLHK
jgi:hypothetical protein